MKLHTLILILAVAARSAAADPVHSLVVHVAPAAGDAGEPILLEAMIDAPFAEQLVVRWRPVGDAAWRDAAFERSSAGGWYATLPPAAAPGVEYYIRGTDSEGGEVDHFASAEAPHVVRVEPTVGDRLEANDRERLGGLADEVSLDVMGQDFTNRYNLTDRFVRGELTYTHRLLRTLYEVGFGFGSIDGTTPEMSAPDAGTIGHGLRYGYGQVRVRLDPSVFVDLRVGLGASYAGFEQNVRGVLTLGKPWRSSVQIGGEYFGDLGSNAWVRLQWDTAPPFVMGASVIRTDLPGQLLDRAGLCIAYDVAYRIGPRWTVKGQVSAGARDGSANLGGGFGTAVAF